MLWRRYKSVLVICCLSLQHTAQEGRVLDEGLLQLSRLLSELEEFINSPIEAKGSVLLRDLNSFPIPDHSRLLHNLTAAGSYILLFIQLAKFPPVSITQ